MIQLVPRLNLILENEDIESNTLTDQFEYKVNQLGDDR